MIENEFLPILNFKKTACFNDFFRKEIWMGTYSQITVMSIPVLLMLSIK